jgi:hypothetical protein
MVVRALGSSLRPAPVLVLGAATTAAYVTLLVWSMAKGDYDLWVAVLLIPILMLGTMPALRRQALRERDLTLFRLLTFALAIKLLSAFVRFFVAFGLYGGVADAAIYHDWGVRISENFRSLVFDTGLTNLSDTQFIRFLTGLVYTAIGPSELGGFLLFSWLGFLGMFLLYRAFVIAVPCGRARSYAHLLFFFPSMLFWPSSIGKEAWMILAIGLASCGVAKILVEETARGIVPFLLGTWMMLVVRPHIAAMLGIAAVVAYAVKRSPADRRELTPIVKGVAVGLLVLGALVLVQRTDDFLRQSGVRGADVTETLEETSFRTREGSSAFTPSVLDSPQRAPMAAVTVLFRPVLLEANNVQAALAALEGTVLLLWCAWRWRWILAAIASVRRQPYVAMAITYIGVFVFGFSSMANFGLLARQRVQVLPFLFVLLAIPPREGGDGTERRRSSALEQVG